MASPNLMTTVQSRLSLIRHKSGIHSKLYKVATNPGRLLARVLIFTYPSCIHVVLCLICQHIQSVEQLRGVISSQSAVAAAMSCHRAPVVLVLLLGVALAYGNPYRRQTSGELNDLDDFSSSNLA